MEGARQLLVPCILLLAGCHRTVPPPLPTYAPPPTTYVPGSGGTNAFDAYVLAAAEAEVAVAPFRYKPLGRTFFTPGQRKALMKALAPALRRIDSARAACDFRYAPVRPGDPLPDRAAWRLLGRALRWRIDDALAAGSARNAVAEAAVAFRFGNDLCGGGPADRTLGVEIANDARLAVVPTLTRLDADGLRRLGEATKAGLRRRPSLDRTFANADADAALAMQTLVDAVRSDNYGRLKGDFGRDFRDLEGIRGLSAEKRAALFAGLEENRTRLAAAWRAAAALPASGRAKILDVKLSGDKAQKTFARHYFLVGRPLLAIEDRSLARLRLLVLEAELRRVVLARKAAPTSLDKVQKPWGIDPYNGRSFGYQPDGAEFRVYSVGENLKDDLGDTDSAGLEPDIRTIVP